MQVADVLHVEVAYAVPEEQALRQIALAPGATVNDALAMVAAEAPFSGLDLSVHSVGVFGQVCELTRVLQDGDRVEIYRELKMDAKTARLKRAAQQTGQPSD